MHVINTLLPVFLIIAVGAVLHWKRLLTEQVLTGMKWLVYWIGLPALLVHGIMGATLSGTMINTLVIVLGGTGAAIIISLLAALIFRMRSERVGTFIQASFRGNLAFVGLPIIIYAFSAAGSDPSAAEQTALLTIGPLVVVYNVVAVVVLLASQHKFGWSALRKMFMGLVTNPLLLACVVGTVGAIMEIDLPPVMGRTLQTLGDMTLPLALLCVGGALVGTSIQGSLLPVAGSVVCKLAVTPLAGYLVARTIEAGPVETGVALILLATPTAVSSYVLADQMDGDSALAASAVVVNTLVCPLSLSLVV
ncbi:MAG: AEC family transporter, partial [Planctomycetota bacterium]